MLFLVFWIGYYLFTVTGYTQYPWWHRFKADSDNVHAITTLAIVNGGEFQFIYHPGATVHQFHGVIYRGLAFIDQKFQPLLQLAQVTGQEEAIGILAQGTQTSRSIVFPTMIIFAGLVYILFFRITSNRLISCLMTFYLFSSDALLMYTQMIRPEPFSLIYFLLAYLIAIRAFRKDQAVTLSSFVKTLVLIGFFLSYAVFSKIQIGPAVILFLAVLTYYLQNIFQKKNLVPLNQNSTRFGLILSVVNIIAFPWWTMKKPGFLTQPYLDSLKDVFNMNVFGPAPENFSIYPFFGLLILIILSGLIYARHDRPPMAKVIRFTFPAVLSYNSLVAGFTAAVYTIFLPVSRSFNMYLDNTNNMMYGIITNSLYGKWFLHRVLDLSTFQKIYANLNVYGRFLNINMVTIILGLSVWCIVRIYLKSTRHRKVYFLALGWFFLGLLTDILGTMRSDTYFDYYMLYPVCFYATGIVHVIALELNQLIRQFPSRRVYQMVSVFLIGLLMIQSLSRCYYLLNQPKSTGKSGQDPSVEFSLIIVFGQPFWKVAGQDTPNSYPVTGR